ncbi:hypothetical protein JHK84_034998 [Glycine max]|nr:hypothetical protein JHK86_034734 [Glycine max]KAG5141230.1 hypothetical protein JHK84_034998 [Glycine max]
MLEKERSSGMYRLSSYFMSRVVADLQMELSLPSIFIHTLLLHVLVSQDLGASVMDHVLVFISWVKCISISYYNYQLFIASQYSNGETYPCSTGQCQVAEFPSIKQTGFHFNLQEQVMAASALVIMMIDYRLIAYVALMRIGVTKK